MQRSLSTTATSSNFSASMGQASTQAEQALQVSASI
jgi:hypothetical protein